MAAAVSAGIVGIAITLSTTPKIPIAETAGHALSIVAHAFDIANIALAVSMCAGNAVSVPFAAATVEVNPPSISQ